MEHFRTNHLYELEAVAMLVLREVAAQFERPGILFSGGKDSIVVTHLVCKAFFPARIPLPHVHIDTGRTFQETLEFRGLPAQDLQLDLIVRSLKRASTRARFRKSWALRPAATVSKQRPKNQPDVFY
jgi:sulfate adenylyltransferase subunit 2